MQEGYTYTLPNAYANGITFTIRSGQSRVAQRSIGGGAGIINVAQARPYVVNLLLDLLNLGDGWPARMAANDKLQFVWIQYLLFMVSVWG